MRVFPEDDETLLLAAQAARRDGELAEAARLLVAAEQANAVPEAVAFERLLLEMQSGNLTAADHYFQICQTHPESEPAPLILEAIIVGSLRAMDLGRAQESLDLWDRIRHSPPDQTQAKIWRGELAIRTGDVDTAADYYRQAVEADPDHDAARLRLGDLLARYAPQEARAHLELLRQEQPHGRDVLFHLARCHRALGEHDKATRILTDLADHSPDDLPVILELGRVALDLRRLDEAERWFRRAVSLAPDRREPNFALARCLQLAGKDDEARRYRDKVAQIDTLLDKRIKNLMEKGLLTE